MHLKSLSTQGIGRIPQWMVLVQAVLFAILYSIWALPETILIRHICLIGGALISLFIIYQYRFQFWKKEALPIFLIGGLFIWICFHLLFLSVDFLAQYSEFSSIWKRTAIGVIFAVGFGLALSREMAQKDQVSEKKRDLVWGALYLGLLSPTLIYMVKFVLTDKALQWGLVVPDYWRLYKEASLFYVAKTVYVCFCLPVLGVALGQLARNIDRGLLFRLTNVAYLATVPAVFFVFYGENIKNGVIYGAALLIAFVGHLLLKDFRQHWQFKIALISLILGLGSLFLANHLEQNNSWKTFKADAKIAFDTQNYEEWKYSGEKGFPNNEFGTMVSITNYERLAWGKTGLELIAQNPLGFGLVEGSFGRMAKEKWPDSKLHQSHSGWIDLTLGLGIPGFLLIFTPFLIVLYRLRGLAKVDKESPEIRKDNQQNLYGAALWWVLFSLLIMWCTTEISQKVYFDNLLFWLTIGAAYYLGSGSNFANDPGQADAERSKA